MNRYSSLKKTNKLFIQRSFPTKLPLINGIIIIYNNFWILDAINSNYFSDSQKYLPRKNKSKILEKRSESLKFIPELQKSPKTNLLTSNLNDEINKRTTDDESNLNSLDTEHSSQNKTSEEFTKEEKTNTPEAM